MLTAEQITERLVQVVSSKQDPKYYGVAWPGEKDGYWFGIEHAEAYAVKKRAMLLPVVRAALEMALRASLEDCPVSAERVESILAFTDHDQAADGSPFPSNASTAPNRIDIADLAKVVRHLALRLAVFGRDSAEYQAGHEAGRRQGMREAREAVEQSTVYGRESALSALAQLEGQS